MAKLGRPRSTEEAIDKLARLKRTDLEGAGDQRLQNWLGRLYKADSLTEVEFLAGEGFSALVANYRRVKGLPSGRPKPNQFEQRIPGNSDFDYEQDYVQKIEDHYNDVNIALVGAHGEGGLALVRDVCLSDKWPALFERTLLKAALATIAQRLRLSSK